MALVHASCVAIAGTGVLLRGAPGSGKSDLAFRLIDGGARLVADDQVDLRRDVGDLIATAPPRLHGLLEVRGLGIMRYPAAPEATLGLVIDLVFDDSVERLPEPIEWEIEGVRLPGLSVAAFHPSSSALLRAAVAALREDAMLVGAFAEEAP